tara:strand:+ start:474 stop:656 length:183 start_codon:yes stop_codon:yes gene_type:complete
VFNNVQSFSAVKSSNIEGIAEGLVDMMEKDHYPLALPIKREKDYIHIVVKYKKIEKWEIN